MEQRTKINSQIVDEASSWFIECRAGDLDEAGRLEFDTWLRRSPEHLRAYLEVAAIWNEGPALDPMGKWDGATLISQAAEDPDNVVALREFTADNKAQTSSDRAIVHNAPPRERRFIPRPGKRAFVLAASLTGVLATAATWLWSQMYASIYTTGMGEQRILELADSSTVEMNSRSRVHVRYTRDERAVDILTGEALFNVTKDSARPFVVGVGGTRVRVVGTQFDVYKKAHTTVVTVVEGRVSVVAPAPVLPGKDIEGSNARSNAARSATPILVSAGEQLTMTSNFAKLAEHTNLAAVTAWTQRRILFDSATLLEVAEEFNRYNSRQLIIDTPELLQFHISGTFSSTDPESFVRFLRERPDVRVIETSSEIRISKKDS
jgi:transmembrane sensor